MKSTRDSVRNFDRVSIPWDVLEGSRIMLETERIIFWEVMDKVAIRLEESTGCDQY